MRFLSAGGRRRNYSAELGRESAAGLDINADSVASGLSRENVREVDTAWRYIYIHGCPDELMNGKPESHGCIRMKNADVLDLFDRVQAGMPVCIH